jgi:hypothetical protein
MNKTEGEYIEMVGEHGAGVILYPKRQRSERICKAAVERRLTEEV